MSVVLLYVVALLVLRRGVVTIRACVRGRHLVRGQTCRCTAGQAAVGLVVEGVLRLLNLNLVGLCTEGLLLDVCCWLLVDGSF